MEKIDKFLNSKISTSIKQNYIKALEDEAFRRLITQYKIDEEVGMKYTSRLMDSSKEHTNCSNCPSLAACSNSVRGFCLTPKQNKNTINFSYDMCKYLKKEEYRENVQVFDVAKDIKNASIKNIYTNDKNRIEIIKAIKNFINEYKKGNNPKGIYLHGSFGSGKTYLISALFNELAKSRTTSVIIHTPELLRSLKDSFSTDYSEKFYLLKHTPLLLLDDIGAEYLTAWGRDEVIEPILQYRMDEGLPTFFTSNFTILELEKHFTTASNSIDKVKARRIIERIKQLSVEVELISKNLR
ncbi:primosome component (Helicase loader) [Clostridium sp. CAG:710]|nr:primosome component (Helicase loader) [Clostridium sp. CAG:710]